MVYAAKQEDHEEIEDEDNFLPAHMKNKNPIIAPWGFHTNEYLVRKCKAREQKSIEQSEAEDKNQVQNEVEVQNKDKSLDSPTKKKVGFLQKLKSYVVKPKKNKNSSKKGLNQKSQ